MLVIRLRRIGRKHDPHYRIVVAEHTAPVQGKFIVEVGHYSPKTKELAINSDQFLGWIERGAKPSNTVAKLAERSDITHEHIVVKEFKGKPKKKPAESTSPSEAIAATEAANGQTTPDETPSQAESPEAMPEDVAKTAE